MQLRNGEDGKQSCNAPITSGRIIKLLMSNYLLGQGLFSWCYMLCTNAAKNILLFPEDGWMKQAQ